MTLIKTLSHEDYEKFKKVNKVIVDKPLVDIKKEDLDYQGNIPTKRLVEEINNPDSILNLMNITSSNIVRLNFSIDRETPSVIFNKNKVQVASKGKTDVKIYDMLRNRENELVLKLYEYGKQDIPLNTKSITDYTKSEQVYNRILKSIREYVEESGQFEDIYIDLDDKIEAYFKSDGKKETCIDFDIVKVEGIMISFRMYKRNYIKNTDTENLSMIHIKKDQIEEYTASRGSSNSLGELIKTEIAEKLKELVLKLAKNSEEKDTEEKPKRKKWINHSKKA